jgi:hypothetical protein
MTVRQQRPEPLSSSPCCSSGLSVSLKEAGFQSQAQEIRIGVVVGVGEVFEESLAGFA